MRQRQKEKTELSFFLRFRKIFRDCFIKWLLGDGKRYHTYGITRTYPLGLTSPVVVWLTPSLLGRAVFGLIPD